jgi:hypothetical protein
MAARRKSGPRRVCRCAVELRKRAYHFLRNAAAIFSIIHRSPTQISHNAIRNPMTSSRKPTSFQKDLPPPGTYDGACAIVKRNPSPCIWKALRLISAEARHQQTCNLGCDHRIARLKACDLNFSQGKPPDLPSHSCLASLSGLIGHAPTRSMRIFVKIHERVHLISTL